VVCRKASSWITLYHGPEFISRALDIWAYRHGVTLSFIRPGKPTENAYIESFHSRFRDECLSAHWFLDLADARFQIEAWRRDYNDLRPHTSLAGLTPTEWARTAPQVNILTRLSA
jgi:putative transposase